MKLSMLGIVQRTVQARDLVQRELAALESGELVITLGGCPQDDAMKAVATPAIERELLGRIASLNRDLETYGVTVDHREPAPQHRV